MVKITSLCVYCGARPGTDQAYAQEAVRLGQLLAERGITLVTGGGHVGLMGICADAVLDAGGRVVGVIPRHLMGRELGHRGLTELLVTDDMHSRKAKMFEIADAFAVLPGGLGTLDETLEMVTWRQLGLHDKPIVLVSIGGYWTPLLAVIERIIEAGFAGPDARALVKMVGSVEEVLPAIEAAPAPRVPPNVDLT